MSRLLGHTSPAITLNTYTYAFNSAEQDDKTRSAMEDAYDGMLG